ncbi:WD repeat-containing protein 91 isoform X1 [Tachypleus tridentatus]|uniref:WD repeat-containing protein 91 isoform X1 n=1 Tax=Tachypleus tridentatus TaxID=6853 RepID=UPI003FD61F46
MAAISFADELVRDYLLFRGFMGTLKAFDADIKSDKDKGFRPDRIVDHLSSCISNLDLSALREAWTHLDQRIFSRLEHSFLTAAKKLETALLRMYVVACVTSSRQDKLLEFFERMSHELQGQSEWKDWFALPFLKSPEENPAFQVYFTRQWQDTMLVSLHNFLSVIFQSMALPTLLSYEDEVVKLTALQEENEILRQQLSSGQVGEDKSDAVKTGAEESIIHDIPPPQEPMDDFYAIAQEVPVSESTSKSIKSLIRNISSGLPTSPILGRRQQQSQTGPKRSSGEELSAAGKPVSAVKPKPRAPSAPPHSSASSGPAAVARVRPQSDHEQRRRIPSQSKEKEEKLVVQTPSGGQITEGSLAKGSSVTAFHIGTGSEHKETLILLSQEEFSEHHSCVTHCKFNSSGSMVASSDMDGVIKVWTASPSPKTFATVISKSSVLALEWATKRERLLLHGNKSGSLKIYDTKERRTVCDISADSAGCLKEQRIMSITCSPTEASFVCSTCPPPPRYTSRSEVPSSPLQGKLLLWDMRTMQLERQLHVANTQSVINCCSFNHNGQLLLAGTSEGKICLFDMRTCECITNWVAHNGEVYSTQFSTDETACYTMGNDGKFIQWSINKTGQRISELSVHSGATGPFTLTGHPTTHRHNPVGKLFAFDCDGSHVLTCGGSGGIVYKLTSGMVSPLLSLGGHKWPVVTVDWSTPMDCGTCITGSLDGRIIVSTLLAQ